MENQQELLSFLSISPFDTLPPRQKRSSDIPHAPKRIHGLSAKEKIVFLFFLSFPSQLAIGNALRYFPSEWHSELCEEFLDELDEFGHIYMYRFMPKNYKVFLFALSFVFVVILIFIYQR